MLEILLFIGALGGIGTRAHQRGLDRTAYVGAAAVGWVVLLVLSLTALGPVGLLLRWGWLGGVYLFIEISHGGAKLSDRTWRCPDCLMYNEGSTFVCLCGYRHPEAPPDLAAPAPSANEPGRREDG